MSKDTIVSAETQTFLEVQNKETQVEFKPTHKRSGSDVIEGIDVHSVSSKCQENLPDITNLNIPAEYNPSRRRSSDVVDSIGFKIENVTKKTTEVDGSEGRAERPTFLDMEESASAASHEKTKALKKSKELSKEFIDATPSSPPENIKDLESDLSAAEAVEAVMPVAMNAVEYNMKHKRRGHAVIFNHDVFDTSDYLPRDGSYKDVSRLNDKFSDLGFDVTVHNNLEYSKIREAIAVLADEDHSDADCLAVIVLTHGENGQLKPRDSNVSYSVELLWKPFTADKCPTLAGKPKLFFIQACRGTKLDPGIKVKRGGIEFDSSPAAYKIPTHADFLIAFSSVEGFYSFRNVDTGTWFIQALCKELNTSDNILQILTRTMLCVSQQESDSENPLFHQRKQVPCITTMLTRDLYFRPKN